MQEPSRRVIVLELNEITWDLVDPLMERGALPNFRALVEGGARAEAWASEAPEHLDPWVTWTTVYTGVPQSVHGLSILEQEGATLGARRIWELLDEADLRIGLFGSANSWPPREVNGFWVPGPFSRNFATFPKDLEPIQALNVGLTRGHTAAGVPPPRMFRLLPQLVRLGLAPATLLLVGRELVAMRRNPATRWKKIALQPVINLDLFARLYTRYQPHFATFHSNHVAYYQHRFWRAMDPTVFEVPPTEEERRTYGGCIEHGYRVADRILGRLRRLAGPEAHLVVLSSCGQQPATGGRYSEDQKQGHVGLQIRIEALLDALGAAGRVRHSNLMAPQWKLDGDDSSFLRGTAANLEQARNLTRGIPAFAVHREGESICLGARRDQQLDDEIELSSASGPRRLRAGELLVRHAEVVKSGRHHPKGVLLMHGPAVKPGSVLPPCDNLDIAPTLLQLLGQPAARCMTGRPLTETFRTESGGRRELAAA